MGLLALSRIPPQPAPHCRPLPYLSHSLKCSCRCYVAEGWLPHLIYAFTQMSIFDLKSHQWYAGKCLSAACLRKQAAVCIICKFLQCKYLAISSYQGDVTELILLNVELGERCHHQLIFPEYESLSHRACYLSPYPLFIICLFLIIPPGIFVCCLHWCFVRTRPSVE